MSADVWNNVNTDEKEVRRPWVADDVADENKSLRIMLSKDYARFEASAYVTNAKGSALVNIGVWVEGWTFGDLRDSLARTDPGEVVYNDCAVSRASLRITRTEDKQLVCEFEGEQVVNPPTVTITLSAEEADNLQRLFAAQVEAEEEAEAAKVRVKKTFAEWERIIAAHKEKGRWDHGIGDQIHCQGYVADDEVEVVFTDAYESEGALEVCTVTLSATVANWQRVADILRADHNESLALGVEEALEDHLFGASPIQSVDLEFDWNESPDIEAVMWRLAIFGAYTEAVAPFATVLMVG